MSSDSSHVILIIGGGLGGLALAHLLLQSSSTIQVHIFERDENENGREQGYCIGIDPTGLEVLEKIRVLDDLLWDESDGYCSLSSFRLVNKYLQKLFDFNAKGTKLIYREDLRRALLQNLDVQWNKRFLSYKMLDDKIEAYFEDGTSVQGSVLIGCDGTKSLVREQLIPNFERKDLNIINVGGSVEQNDELKQIKQLTQDSLVRIFGRQGHSLLLLPFRQSWVWALSWPEQDKQNEHREYSQAQLIDKARRYFDHEDAVRLLELSAASVRIGPYRLYSASLLKHNPFPNNPRVTLLGDSAHPMTTHAGKGANTAFADAFDLATVLLNPTKASLAEYEQKMFKRGFEAVRMSLSSTTMIHSTGWRALLRDCIFSTVHYAILVINVVSFPLRWFRKKRD